MGDFDWGQDHLLEAVFLLTKIHPWFNMIKIQKKGAVKTAPVITNLQRLSDLYLL
jgi:hypothetical protein